MSIAHSIALAVGLICIVAIVLVALAFLAANLEDNP